MARDRRSEGKPGRSAAGEAVATATHDQDLDMQRMSTGVETRKMEEKDLPRPDLATSGHETSGGEDKPETAERGVAPRSGTKALPPKRSTPKTKEERIWEHVRLGHHTAPAPDSDVGTHTKGTENLDMPLLSSGTPRHDEPIHEGDIGPRSLERSAPEKNNDGG